MGDSGAYLNTALTGSIPGERSFTYGFLLRAIAVWPHSLHSMVWIQTALSACSCWIVAICLVRYFQAGLALAAVCSLLCAIEPLQLLSERYVLTEAVATFLFALFVLSCFEYLAGARLFWLGSVQVIGVLLISIRISFLPAVLFASVCLPILRARWRRPEWKMTARRVILPVLFSLALSQSLLLGYRHLYGYLIAPPMHNHPAYFYRDGLFLLSDFAPIVTPADYPVPSQRAAVFGRLRVPLHDLKARDEQRWLEGGLCSEIVAEYKGDEYKADEVARETALRAIKHHPLAVVEIGAATFAEYFEKSYLTSTLLIDNGSDRQLEPSLVAEYKRDFGEDFGTLPPQSFTKWWQENSFVWDCFLLCLPFLFLAHLIFYRHMSSPCHWLCAVFLFAFLEGAIVTVTRPTPRFLTTMAWLSLLVIGATANDFFKLVTRRTKLLY